MSSFGPNNHAAGAWANINGSTAAFRDSFNTSSLTDNGTGDFTVNFSTSFSNVSHSSSGMANQNQTTNYNRNVSLVGTLSSSSVRTRSCYSPTGGLGDWESIQIMTHGDI